MEDKAPIKVTATKRLRRLESRKEMESLRDELEDALSSMDKAVPRPRFGLIVNVNN
jgi:hypothetical protein